MRLLHLMLENIRSYEKVEISFPGGMSLLSGDIGAGKSTLLMGIEFALFGIGRGELSGAALLRHGAQSGIARLTFTDGKDEHTIQRSLKRTKNGIVQDIGWLEKDGQRETLTPTELKARIYDILGYPQQTLNKKNLLYRFTIYTPQEDMKTILAQSADERLETIRRIFGVDTYTTMRANAHVLARDLKSSAKEREEVLRTLTHEIERIDARIGREPGIVEQLALLQAECATMVTDEKRAEELCAQKERELAIAKEQAQHATMRARARDLALKERADLEKQIAMRRAQSETQEAAVTALRERLAALGPARDGVDAQLATIAQAIAAVHKDLGRFQSIKEQTISLPQGVCPTCKQEVGETHIASVHEEIRAQREAAERRIAKLAEQEVVYTKERERLEGERKTAAERTELASRVAMMGERIGEIGADLVRLQALLAEKAESPLPEEQKAVPLKPLEDALAAAKQERARVRVRLESAQRRYAMLEQERTELAALRSRKEEIAEERSLHEGLVSRNTALVSWIDERFEPFTRLLERTMLLAIHTTFDAALRAWFAQLIEDDAIAARLDGEFSVLLDQEGFETSIEHLSGGERTAVALAYRLALVHTIHVLLPDLATAGLIILDEPTDGFSSEQLARMRDVLSELAMDQVLLVSHERQLEGFVDNILRIEKTAGSSLVKEAL